jgi:hypothetical protein
LFFTAKSKESIFKENGKENGGNNWQFTLYTPVKMFSIWGLIYEVKRRKPTVATTCVRPFFICV